MSAVRVIDLQPGPQRAMAESTATLVLFGGGRGSGKSYSACLTGAKWFDVPGYGCVIFRRISKDLTGTGSIWEDTTRIYPYLGGVPVESKLTWRFPSGAQIQMSHLEHPKDVARWQGRNLARIVFDEAQHFEPSQFWFLLSCLRTTCGVQTQFICTFNPDPDGWLMDFVRPYLDEAGFPRRGLSGVVRWFGRKDGKLATFASREDGIAAGVDGLTSYTYIPSLIWDNPALLKSDPEYLEKLKVLPPVERAQFLDGCWLLRRKSGDMLQSQWLPILQHGTLARRAAGQPDDREIVRWVLTADLGGSPKEGDLVPGVDVPRDTLEATRDPDWSRILLLGQFRDGRVVVWNMWSYRDVPGAVEVAMKRIAASCPKGVTVVMSQDPGQQGIHQIEDYRRTLRGVARFETTTPLNPLYVATYVSRLAFRGLVLLRDPDVSPWHDAFCREFDGYSSDGDHATKHDDIISALGLGVIYLAQKHHPGVAKALPSLDVEMTGTDAVNIRTAAHFRVM